MIRAEEAGTLGAGVGVELPGTDWVAGGFDALPITSFRGLAFDVVGRRGEPVRVLSAAEQRRWSWNCWT